MWKIAVLFVCMTAAATCPVYATNLSYDGELSANGVPAEGWFDFRFQVFDAKDPEQSQSIGVDVAVPGILVRNGNFNVEIDPGADIGGRSQVWLEIGVRQVGAFGDYTTLEPRQRLVLRQSQTPETKAGTTPSGAIVYFGTASCPAGWSEYVPARGRFVLGLQAAGTVGATYGTPLSNLEQRQHDHTFSHYVTTTATGAHGHAWSRIYIAGNGDHIWSSYTSSGNAILASIWGNGVGNEGSGLYPLSAQPTQTLYTNQVSNHNHDVHVTGTSGSGSLTLPYIQLLTCQKD